MIQAALQRRPWAGAGLAALLAVALYGQTISHDFVYDDQMAIVANPAVQTADVALILTSNFWGPAEADRIATWRPAVTASFALDATLADVIGPGVQAAWMHAVNVLFLVGLCVAFWLLCRALGAGAGAATLGAMLLACHPAASESGAWLVARADLMVALFGMLYLRAHVLGRHGQAVGWLILAVASKETGLLLPFVAALWSLGRARRHNEALTLRPWLMAAGVIVAWLVGRWLIFGGLVGPAPTMVENPAVEAGGVQRVLAAVHVFGLGARLLGLPLWLSSDYGLDHFPAMQISHWTVIGGAVLIAGIGLGWRWWRRWPDGLVWWGLLAGPALLYSHVLTPLPTGFAERLWMLPLCGLCGALACGLGSADSAEERPWLRPRMLVAIGLILCLAGALRTAWRLPDWRDDTAVYTAMLRDAPRSYRGLVNGASILVERGDADAARRLLQAATRVHAATPRAWLSLAQVEIAAGQRDAALAALGEAGRVGGSTDKTAAVRCAWQVRWAPPDVALKTCEKAARPGSRGLDGERLMYLAMAKDKAGDAAAARAGMEAALNAFPGHRVPFIARLNAGVLFARQQHWARAQDELELAVAGQPANPAARAMLQAVCERHMVSLQDKAGADAVRQRNRAVRCVTELGRQGDS